MQKTKKTAQGVLIIPMGEGTLATLTHQVAVVHRERCGRVSQQWLSACSELDIVEVTQGETVQQIKLIKQ